MLYCVLKTESESFVSHNLVFILVLFFFLKFLSTIFECLFNCSQFGPAGLFYAIFRTTNFLPHCFFSSDDLTFCPPNERKTEVFSEPSGSLVSVYD